MNLTENYAKKPASKDAINFDRIFSNSTIHPFDQIKWVNRNVEITNDDGQVIFKQDDVETPEFWSDLAVKVVVSKYFYGQPGNDREKSIKQLISRVCDTITGWGINGGHLTMETAQLFNWELTWLCLHQFAAFNSPVWFNVGLWHKYNVGVQASGNYWRDPDTGAIALAATQYEHPQCSACFIVGVEDNMDSIMELAKTEARLFKYGSGTGTNLSSLRSHHEKLSGGGIPSGPVSFLRIYDQVANVVKSGGRVRRAAKLNCLNDWHPDIEEFIELKAIEEAKARALINSGFDGSFNGPVYRDTLAFQNENLSVRASDSFMSAASTGGEWWTKAVTTGERIECKDPKALLQKIAQCAWVSGDPGLQFDDTIHRWHTCKGSGRQRATNPCFVGDTLVDTSDGMIPIKTLAEMSKLGVQLPYAFSWDAVGSTTVLRPILKAWKTKTVTRLAVVKTEKQVELRCTPDHRFILRNGQEVMAKDLRLGDRLRKINRAMHPHGRWSIQSKAGHHGMMDQHRFVWQQINGQIPDGYDIHHKNEDKLDDRLSNLEMMESKGHEAYHAGTKNPNSWDVDEAKLVEVYEAVLMAPCFDIGQRRKVPVSATRWNRYIMDNGLNGVVPMAQSRADLGVGVYKIRGLLWIEFCAKMEEKLALLNDRVVEVSIIDVDPVDVYDLEVEDTHNFGVRNSGYGHSIVVHNCAEFLWLDNSSCNLASLNLLKFLTPNDGFDVRRFKAAVDILITAQDIIVDNASYPTPEIAKNSHEYRTLGLGYSNLGALLMVCGLPYDSQAGRLLAASITSLMTAKAYHQSAVMAQYLGKFDGLQGDNVQSMHDVIEQHRTHTHGLMADNDVHYLSAKIFDEAITCWCGAVDLGRRHGYRNAQVTVLAPVGTIGFMMDCATTGIEPELALVKFKTLAGGGLLKLVNPNTLEALHGLHYEADVVERITQHINKYQTIEDQPDVKSGLKPEHLPIFDCALCPAGGHRFIDHKAHVHMMAAVTPFLSGSVSKTVNMPSTATVQDVFDTYMLAWTSGVKCISIYRDGSKQSQPLTTDVKKIQDKKRVKEVTIPKRNRLPETRSSITHKFSIAGHEGYITVGMFENLKPGELFITMAKEGSTVGGLMDCIGALTSMALQYGVPLDTLVKKFSYSHFEPSGFTANEQIRSASSIIDYVFRWLELNFSAEQPRPQPKKNGHVTPQELPKLVQKSSDTPMCADCGHVTVRNGACFKCLNCGSSLGCS